jgi:hypothetical protein
MGLDRAALALASKARPGVLYLEHGGQYGLGICALVRVNGSRVRRQLKGVLQRGGQLPQLQAE